MESSDDDFAGLDVGGKRTAVCILDQAGKIVWRGMADTHPEIIDAFLQRFKCELTKVGLESGPFTPHLFRSLASMDYPVVCMDARRAAHAIKSRRIKSDKGDAWALAEMLRTGWFTSVHVKSADTHRLKVLLGVAINWSRSSVRWEPKFEDFSGHLVSNCHHAQG